MCMGEGGVRLKCEGVDGVSEYHRTPAAKEEDGNTETYRRMSLKMF